MKVPYISTHARMNPVVKGYNMKKSSIWNTLDYPSPKIIFKKSYHVTYCDSLTCLDCFEFDFVFDHCFEFDLVVIEQGNESPFPETAGKWQPQLLGNTVRETEISEETNKGIADDWKAWKEGFQTFFNFEKRFFTRSILKV